MLEITQPLFTPQPLLVLELSAHAGDMQPPEKPSLMPFITSKKKPKAPLQKLLPPVSVVIFHKRRKNQGNNDKESSQTLSLL
ncbi:hypothetical protein AXF42_Ash021522 [Apostasia shenzhenica]|uniref:Uncharacterized protein n=1 Tax=Apostasia shenzhenica TaxID=1088818 RepID=A0A2H9ZRX3_9ASPA|nr:hypothetical protein AXF42_Ash021522 [Apostasia shenzhenica]